MAEYLRRNIGGFTVMVMFTIIALASAYSLIILVGRPPAPIEQLCSSEKPAKVGFRGSRHSLVITKVDGTTSVMPVGSCATVVEIELPPLVSQ